MNRLRAILGGGEEPDREAQAAAWALLRASAEPKALADAEFDRWISTSKHHADSFADAEHVLSLLDQNAGTDQIMAMRQRALESAELTVSWSTMIKVAAALIATVGLSTFAINIPWKGDPVSDEIAKLPLKPQAYTTAIGERATISLPDGSVATLDTNSSMIVNYDRFERGVKLDRGQAVFEVAKHQRLPFQVYALGQRITAVGTKFNVRIDQSTVKVAMLEGKVLVQPQVARRSAAPAPALSMVAGEVLSVAPGQPIRIIARDTNSDASWKDGTVVFRDTSLPDAVAEINRYTTNPIQLKQISGETFRVSGVFQTRDPQHFAKVMTKLFPVRFEYSNNGQPIMSSIR